jgi:beta-1,4-mannosyl-glycoprotein beta-1,4-N-acetylglucosaminyltransferase
MIYDCFMFFNELDILEIRLNELYNVVDKFVLVESKQSFTKKPKKLFFEENKERFSKFLDKIIHIIIDFSSNLPIGWTLENYQRNQILQGLTKCNENDIIIISDVDEIPKRELFTKYNLLYIEQMLLNNFLQLNQKLSYYFLNLEDSYKWYGSVITTYQTLKQFSPQFFRELRESGNGIKIDNGGWHLSYIADIENIQLKLKSAAHTEFSGEEYTNTENLKKCLEDGVLFFDKQRKFNYIPIKECNLPDYVKQNLDKFKNFIYKMKINLDLCITLRCNYNCLNCIQFCNKEEITGLNYFNSDMTLGQIDNFINQVKSFGKTNFLNNINVTGGEPLLHPDIEKIMIKLEELKKDHYVKSITINSNKIITSPQSLKDYIINYSLPKDNPSKHNVVFLHPLDFSGKKQTYKKCTHYRKHTIVLNYLGYSICCASGAYIRLFCMEDLILNYLPKSLEDFPLKEMDKICEHCPFGSENLPFEKDIGCPISDIYKKEGDKNSYGRKIKKRFPEI